MIKIGHYIKTLLPALLFSLALQQAFAQKDQPGFGKIDKADLDLTDCSFDPGADALTMIDYGNVFYRGGGDFLNTVFEKRVRIKILNERGLYYANVSIPYNDQNNEEQIKKIAGYTFNIDQSGKVKRTKLGKSSMYSKRINKQYSMLIVTFPEAKVGSVIEYRYTMQMQSWQQLKDWYFQGRIPTRYSEYQVNIPSAFRFSIQPFVEDSLEVREAVSEQYLKVEEKTYFVNVLQKSYIMRNLPGVKDEPYMGSAKDYMQRLEFQLSQLDYGDGGLVNIRKTWSDIVELLTNDNDFGAQLDITVPGTEDVVGSAAKIPDLEARIRFIYNYVRNTMSWDEREGIYSENGIAQALNRGSGSTGDINLLLVNLLKRAGLQAWPILFSTRENGLVNTIYPFLRQFNTVMAYIVVGKKHYVLDATDRVSCYTLMPESIVNTSGLIIGGENGQWADIDDITHKYKITSATKGEIDSNGIMRGTALVNSYEYSKKPRAIDWIHDKEKFREEFFSKPGATVRIEDLSVNNAEIDSLPLEQKAQFSYTLDQSGEYRYFSINLFSGLERNPFISDERLSDIDFGYTQEYMIFGSYSIPQGYIFETLPENLSMVMPDNSIVFNRRLQAEDNLLNVRITVSFKRSFYPAMSYPAFAAFYKKLFSRLNEQIVIKRKIAR